MRAPDFGPKIVQQDEIVFFGAMCLYHAQAQQKQVCLMTYFSVSIHTSSRLEPATSIIKAIEESYRPDEHFTLKVAQLDELLAIRHCVFVMACRCWKSVTWKMLARARDDKDPQQKVYIAHLNPKVIPTEFYMVTSCFNHVNARWTVEFNYARPWTT